MKFIHLSNVRLEEENLRSFRNIDINKERWDDLKRVAEACNEQAADALFITGNLFGKTPSQEELQKADEVFGELRSTRVYILTGTMDTPDVPTEALAYSWKSDVTVFSGDTIQRVYVAAWNTEITAAGYSPKTWLKIAPETLTRGKKGAVQILLLPFLLSETEADGLDDLKFDFDYVGCGQKVLYKGNASNKIYSPGIFSPEGFSSQISHGYFLCTLNAGKKQVSLVRQFVKAAGREYVSLNVGLKTDLSFDEVTEQLKDTFNRLGKDNIYNITLEGGMSPTVYIRRDELKDAGLIDTVTDNTDILETIGALKEYKENEPLSRFVRCLFDTDEEDELHVKALEYGMQELL